MNISMVALQQTAVGARTYVDPVADGMAISSESVKRAVEKAWQAREPGVRLPL